MRAALLLLAGISGNLLANPQDIQIDIMLNFMAQSGQLQQQAECTGLPEQRLRELYRSTLRHCGLDHEDPEHETCVKQRLLTTGVPQERWEQCDQDDNPQDAILAQLDAIYERIGERAPTAAEQAHIDQLLTQMQQQGMQELQQMMNHLSAASAGTEDVITLPIMPDSKMLMHIPGGIGIEIGDNMVHSLPGASFASTKTPAQVLAYYQQQLPAFRLHNFSLGDSTEHALMQHLPAGFHYPEAILSGISIPHIHIQQANSIAEQLLPGARTLFFIYYQPGG
ncbi:hypothetical protein WG68_07835 [Arsukibacterium ikkense]|uniref:Uncharacterized protein n=1 Tax=Arsukibacterium ikkense TaxID=336831 RepID=A0A0M2V9S4_9GAMM|nr:hypothetical protein [Arsukibacterium ikkense]KKO45913.1 hypothetical protein WG68_07835 [Arsukibacterium ikkense]